MSETARNTCDGFTIHYNFIRPHEGINDMTPAQACKIDLPFEDGWGDLIYWSTIHKTNN